MKIFNTSRLLRVLTLALILSTTVMTISSCASGKKGGGKKMNSTGKMVW